jgi:hypothetical protein
MQMWGLPVLWWGRVGKLVQFGGGLIVILDLIGSDRLSRAANVVRQKAKHVRRDSRASLRGDPRDFNEQRYGLLVAIAFGGAATIVMFVLYVGGDVFSEFRAWYEQQPFVALLTFIAVVLALCIVFLVLALGLLRTAHLPFVALAWVFDSGRPGHPMRWVAFVVVLVGFHFDLLAS